MPSWHNGWFQGLDAVALYCLLRDRNPGRYVEVGSGHSTAFARQAIEDGGLSTRITCIDPLPRTVVASLAHTVVRSALEDADLRVFDTLEAGDFLFLDGRTAASPTQT